MNTIRDIKIEDNATKINNQNQSNKLFCSNFKKNNSINNNLFFIILTRVELNLWSLVKNQRSLEIHRLSTLIRTINVKKFNRLNIKKKKLLNIFLNFLIENYRGNRHFLGLPLNGQRSWSNANSVRIVNTELRLFLGIKINKQK